MELFPAVSEMDQEVVRTLVGMKLTAKVVCLARCLKEDVDIAGACGAKHLVIENNANPWSCKAIWGISEEEMIRGFVETVSYAKKNGYFVTCMPWDDFRADLGFLERLYKSIVFDAGADRVTLVDTSGNSLPWATMFLMKKLRQWVPGVPLEFHAHNEFGLAAAAMLSAVASGASFVHTCMNGLGNRGGNAATEEVAVAAELLLGVPTGLRLERLKPTSELVETLTRVSISPNKAILGDNLFTYQGGIGIFMFQKMREQGRPHGYVPFVPELVGRKGYEFVLGKSSGKTVVRLKLKELGIEVTDDELKKITVRVKEESVVRKATVSLDLLKDIADAVIGSSTARRGRT
jgi:2-isopropylmalate synthase